MSNNKKSSVDLLITVIGNYDDELLFLFREQIKQAKEMEKEQRISDFRAGIECESDHHGYMWTDKDYPEQWYKDLQGGNND
jgi:histidinol phosphatase-like PHP family hydrolase